MVFLESLSLGEGFLAGFTGGAAVATLVALGVLAIVFVVAIYIYVAWALMVIGQKLNYKRAWLAWIPFANISMVLQLGNFHWAWVFLILIPIVGWIALAVLVIISWWRIFEKRGHPGALALLILGTFVPYLSVVFYIAFLVVIGIVAWKNSSNNGIRIANKKRL